MARGRHTHWKLSFDFEGQYLFFWILNRLCFQWDLLYT